MSAWQRIKFLIKGKAKSPLDKGIFQHISLIAFFAWVGLGADGLSSSCYGPEEAFLALGKYPHLGLFVALASGLTVLLISASYSQIIELFPTGGGGYLVASKLLSSGLGMISGCALLIDYILTITISIASGADALFSFLPPEWYPLKLYFAMSGVILLTLMNTRGVKESVIPLVPIFIIFVITHFFAIVYALVVHFADYPQVVRMTSGEIHMATAEMGFAGMIFLILKAYSMGAGTYTGIEAVSNGLPYLREPRAQTGKMTMRYMSWSFAFTVIGLMVAYLVFNVGHEPGKTLNAVLFKNITINWPQPFGAAFILVTLFSEAMILFVAGQAGFLGGPRVLANMARDRWSPTKFATLSDRLVTQNGVLLMGGAALLIMFFTQGSVRYLVVLYSITVFITFCLSQLGMVRYWLEARHRNPTWKRKIWVSFAGLILTSFILVSVIVLKFNEGGWITLTMAGALIGFAVFIRRHYTHTAKLLHRLNSLVETASASITEHLGGGNAASSPTYDSSGKTAVLFVNGFNGLGLHTLFGVIRLFGKEFKNFVFIEIGIIDAGNFKGAEEVERLKTQVKAELGRYVTFMQHNGFYAESSYQIGIDVIDELDKICETVLVRFPKAIFFGGQLVFPEESFLTRWLHNHTVFLMQRKLYQRGIPFVILPIRV